MSSAALIWIFCFSLQVDESLLSANSDVDTANRQQSNWMQMALPGGGIVSLPVTEQSANPAGTGGGVTSPGSAHSFRPTSGSADVASLMSSGANSELLTLRSQSEASGQPPVTHFNLDQLLELVQSFQLDTTLAGSEQAGSAEAQYQMALAAAAASVADGQLIMQVQKVVGMPKNFCL